MKKIIFSIFALLLVVGCSINNSPSKKVEDFLNKYRTMDDDVIAQLNEVVDSAGTMTQKQKEIYSKLMKKQYQNLTFEIKNESIDGSQATVQVEIEVFDYASSIAKSETYLLTNKTDFVDENNEVDEEKFMNYKLEQLNNVKDKVTYTINFTLTKTDGKWQVDDITDIDRQKLHGLYS